ncbi:MAG: hypothetical protein JRD04_02815 [Deltaproteobacteria bacterium]|nr:hypothetical protein [Deltaproteobacteria bacterium]
MKQLLIFNNDDTVSIGKSFVKLSSLNFSMGKQGLFLYEERGEIDWWAPAPVPRLQVLSRIP